MTSRVPLAAVCFLAQSILGASLCAAGDIQRTAHQYLVKDASGKLEFKEQPRIVGGRNAAIGEIPWQVALIITDKDDATVQWLCGGSIIKDGWVLTAAHCVTGLEDVPGKVEARSGMTDLDDAAAIKGTATIVRVHPLYCDGSHDYDVAVVKVKTDNKPIALATKAPAAGTLVTVSGFGRVSEQGSTSLKLQVGTPEVKSMVACNDRQSYDGHVSDKMLCAGKKAGGQPVDSCQGDSGGPLVVPGNPKTLAGVVSWGEGCARDRKFGVYADVPSLSTWINANAK